MFDKRWRYWIRTIEKGRPLTDPIPQIEFSNRPHTETMTNIKACTRFMNYTGHGVREAWISFIEWLLWGFGASVQQEFPTRVSEDISWHWYKTFNLGLLMKYPADHMAWGSCEIAGMARSGNATGYFPTPQHVVKMMVQMTMKNTDKQETVCDPCLGTGTMLLEASNFSLRLFGQDICLDMVKMATVNAFIYVPWLACPARGLIDWNTLEDYETILKKFEEWQRQQTYSVKILSFQQKSSTLTDWV